MSMKCAMLVVSDVLIRILPSGLMAMPSGSTPTCDVADCARAFEIDDRHRVVILVGDIHDLPAASWANSSDQDRTAARSTTCWVATSIT